MMTSFCLQGITEEDERTYQEESESGFECRLLIVDEVWQRHLSSPLYQQVALVLAKMSLAGEVLIPIGSSDDDRGMFRL